MVRKGRININQIQLLRSLAGPSVISNDDSLSILEKNQQLGQDRCRNLWLTGLLYDREGLHELRDQNWEELFAHSCPVQYLYLLKAKYPADLHYALLANKSYPQEAESWFWAADIYMGYVPNNEIPDSLIDYGLAAIYYQGGLQIDPSDGNIVYLGISPSKRR